MRWKLKTDNIADPIEVELIDIQEGAYTFQVGKEKVTLTNPRIHPFSLTTEELGLTFEVYTKEKWRAVRGAETYTVKSMSWESSNAGAQNEIRTQMPGRVLKIFVKPGDEIKANQTLLIVEAMKMENEIRSAADARVKEVSVASGQSVESGAILIKLE